MDIFTGTLIFLVRLAFHYPELCFSVHGASSRFGRTCLHHHAFGVLDGNLAAGTQTRSGGLVPVAEDHIGRRAVGLVVPFRRVGDSGRHVPEPDKFERFRGERIVRKHFSRHHLRLSLLYASDLVAGYAFGPHGRQVERRFP